MLPCEFAIRRRGRICTVVSTGNHCSGIKVREMYWANVSICVHICKLAVSTVDPPFRSLEMAAKLHV